MPGSARVPAEDLFFECLREFLNIHNYILSVLDFKTIKAVTMKIGLF
jgi:hypothetical protein